MIIWNINKLKETLKAGDLSQQHSFYYIFIFVAFSEIAMEASTYFSFEDYNIYDYINSATYIFIAILGTYLTYVANKKNNGIQFAERFFSLGLVVAVRLIPLVVLFAFLSEYIGTTDVDTEEIPPTTLTDFIFLLSISTAYYWRLIVHIRDVSNNYNA